MVRFPLQSILDNIRNGFGKATAAISNEATARQNADNYIQTQVTANLHQVGNALAGKHPMAHQTIAVSVPSSDTAVKAYSVAGLSSIRVENSALGGSTNFRLTGGVPGQIVSVSSNCASGRMYDYSATRYVNLTSASRAHFVTWTSATNYTFESGLTIYQ